MKRTALLVALSALATLLVCGAVYAAAAVSFAPAKNYPAGNGSRAVSAGDLDGDGDTDLVTANGDGDSVSVLIRRYDGTFKAPQRYAVGDGPGDVIAREDLDGDGARDLAVANGVSDDVSVRLGRGDGTFGAQRKYAVGYGGPLAIEVGDMDGDGDKDLVTANYGGRVESPVDYTPASTVSVFLNAGKGTFAPARHFIAGEAYEPEDVDRGDLDGDGDEDLVVALGATRSRDGGLAVLLNDGSGSFGAPQRYSDVSSATAVVANDLDGDGDNDLAAADYIGDDVYVYKNQGSGAFAYDNDYNTSGPDGGPKAYGISDLTEADFDRDGDIDLASSAWNTDNISVLVNSGDGTFGPHDSARVLGPVGDGPVGITRVRMNADRKPDLVVANMYSDNVSVLVNTTSLRRATSP